MLLNGIRSNETNQSGPNTPMAERRTVLPGILLLSATLLGSSGLLVLSKPGAVMSLLLPRAAQSGRLPAFVREIKDLSAGPPSFQQSTALANALGKRTETISTTGTGVIDNTTLVALAQADWYFQSGQDLSGLYRGRRLEISEGHVLSATRRFLQHRGGRLPVTTWTARLQNRGVLTGRVPPPSWAQSPPSDLTLKGYVGAVRMKIAEQVPELVRGTRNGAIMRPMEAAFLSYVLMTSDNGWIARRQAQMDVTPAEIRSFLGDLGVQIPLRP